MAAHEELLGHVKLFGATLGFGLTEGRKEHSHYMKGERIVNILRDNNPEAFKNFQQMSPSNDGASTTGVGSQSLGKTGNLLSRTMHGADATTFN